MENIPLPVSTRIRIRFALSWRVGPRTLPAGSVQEDRAGHNACGCLDRGLPLRVRVDGI
ncbi:hypothetical protein [Nonomuraea sp. NPDC052265]|uniref:hypothetical protein n=1 Tax=Nonomuraea sp. NPDC052265 TaxID=3364374 RepID=UPI0037CB8E85